VHQHQQQQQQQQQQLLQQQFCQYAAQSQIHSPLCTQQHPAASTVCQAHHSRLEQQ
jgi:hypothetical protein